VGWDSRRSPCHPYPLNPPKPTPGGVNAILAERQKNCLVVGPLESPKITETNKSGMNVTKSPFCISTKAKVEGQPSLVMEEGFIFKDDWG